jgi:hypothetical protein
MWVYRPYTANFLIEHRFFHHIQPVCAITDFQLAIPENVLRFAQAGVCPSPETDLKAIFENLDTTETVFTFPVTSPVRYFSLSPYSGILYSYVFIPQYFSDKVWGGGTKIIGDG